MGRPASHQKFLLHLGVCAVLAALTAPYFKSPPGWTPIAMVDLAFHEAGHVFLGFMPKFVMMFGGTLFQLLMPALCLGKFYRERRTLGVWVCMWWIGENLLGISVYIDDARRQALPLVGGGEHDWTYLLAEVGLLVQNEAVAAVVFASGLLVCAFAGWRIVRAGLGRGEA